MQYCSDLALSNKKALDRSVFPSPALQEAHLILSNDAELKMAVLLGSTAFLGSLVFITCIMLVATNQQLRKLKAERLVADDLKRLSAVGCKFETIHSKSISDEPHWTDLCLRHQLTSFSGGQCDFGRQPRVSLTRQPHSVQDEYYEHSQSTCRRSPEQDLAAYANGSAKPLLHDQ